MTLRCANCGIADDDVLLAVPNPVPLHPGGDKGCRDAALRLLERSRILVQYGANFCERQHQQCGHLEGSQGWKPLAEQARALLEAYPKEAQ